MREEKQSSSEERGEKKGEKVNRSEEMGPRGRPQSVYTALTTFGEEKQREGWVKEKQPEINSQESSSGDSGRRHRRKLFIADGMAVMATAA